MQQGWSIRLGLAAMLLAGCAFEGEVGASSGALHANGRRLFNQETFDGNGRTCATCHGAETGTVSPEQAQARFAADPTDPLFRAIDSDNRMGMSYTRLLTDATILVTLPLPPGWSLAGDPSATSVTMPRAIPSTLNVPALDTIFMADGRFDNLEDQALGAVHDHYEAGREPTAAELTAIADFQQTRRFFSSPELRRYARGGPPPELPPGCTASEQRGREWFVPSPTGLCGHCHSGPMLNETSEFLIAPVPTPPGSRFFTAFVSEFNNAGNPVHTFVVEQPDGTTVTVESPDPGLALITGDPAHANLFRIPTVWGSAQTGPWFHDNSAKTLEDVAQHYSEYFEIVVGRGLTAQDQIDINAYLRLLGPGRLGRCHSDDGECDDDDCDHDHGGHDHGGHDHGGHGHGGHGHGGHGHGGHGHGGHGHGDGHGHGGD